MVAYACTCLVLPLLRKHCRQSRKKSQHRAQAYPFLLLHASHDGLVSLGYVLLGGIRDCSLNLLSLNMVLTNTYQSTVVKVWK